MVCYGCALILQVFQLHQGVSDSCERIDRVDSSFLLSMVAIHIESVGQQDDRKLFGQTVPHVKIADHAIFPEATYFVKGSSSDDHVEW